MTHSISVPRVIIIGPGVMGRAIAADLVTADWAGRVILAARRESSWTISPLAELPSAIERTTSEQITATANDIIILAVKPQNVLGILASLRQRISPETLLISIAAGVKLARLTTASGSRRVVRAMPNMTIQLQQGVTIWTADEAINDEQRQIARQLFDRWGMAEFVDREELLDVATAIFGSGPAYVFMMIEAVMEAAIQLGFPRTANRQLVLQLFSGAIEMAQRSPEIHPAQLRDDIVSPGGTTAQALLVFDERGFKATIKRAAEAAFKRCQELGQE